MKQKPTESELEVLSLIWQQGPLTVRQIHDQIKTNRAIGYTTTLKIMQIMYEKGMLGRTKHGKTHMYTAIEPQQKTQNGIVSRMVQTVFHGSTRDLVMHALGSSRPSKAELDEIKEYLDKLDKETE